MTYMLFMEHQMVLILIKAWLQHVYANEVPHLWPFTCNSVIKIQYHHKFIYIYFSINLSSYSRKWNIILLKWSTCLIYVILFMQFCHLVGCLWTKADRWSRVHSEGTYILPMTVVSWTPMLLLHCVLLTSIWNKQYK